MQGFFAKKLKNLLVERRASETLRAIRELLVCRHVLASVTKEVF
jgi:hypothetical protein